LGKGGIAKILEDDGVSAATMQSMKITAEGSSSV
jgi:hypothetical protein